MGNPTTAEPGGNSVRLDKISISVNVLLSVLLGLVSWWVTFQGNRIDKLEADVDLLQMANFEVQLGISDNLGGIRSDITKLTTTMANIEKSVEELKRTR